MKRIIAVILAAALLTACAFAEAPRAISEELFKLAKGSVVRLAKGEYEKITDELSLTGGDMTAEDLEAFAGKFTTLSADTVQGDISVAYWTKKGWMLAVPVTMPAEEPDPADAPTEAVVFISKNGTEFDSVSRMLWSDVVRAYEDSEYVQWNKELVTSKLNIIVG